MSPETAECGSPENGAANLPGKLKTAKVPFPIFCNETEKLYTL
jgi:hypothetical protein